MKNLLFLLSSGIALQLTAQNNFDQAEIRRQISPEDTKEILYTLASDEMKGRDTKSGGYYKAADFVAAYFKRNNVQAFYPAYRDSLATDSLVSYNIVGSIGKYVPGKKTVLIGAHLDHIGVKGTEGDIIFNGANDNATGSTAVMQIAAFLAQHQ